MKQLQEKMPDILGICIFPIFETCFDLFREVLMRSCQPLTLINQKGHMNKFIQRNLCEMQLCKDEFTKDMPIWHTKDPTITKL